MTTFEDNAVVTAEDLNNIAVDLGDATFSAFSTEKFGVDKLNEITSDLVSKGILTTGNRCEAIIADGKVYIQSGVIVFESGAKIRIEDPVAVDAVNGSYIYAVNDLLTGKASIEAGESLPTTGDYVPIAKVNDAGEIVDLREMSVAKLTLSAELQNNYAEQTVEFVYGENAGDEVIDVPIVPELPQCKYFILKSTSWGKEGQTTYIVDKSVELTEEYQMVHSRTVGNYEQLAVKKTGGLLYFTGSCSNWGTGLYPGTITFILA